MILYNIYNKERSKILVFTVIIKFYPVFSFFFYVINLFGNDSPFDFIHLCKKWLAFKLSQSKLA